jgi:prepilin peptidase CpaA
MSNTLTIGILPALMIVAAATDVTSLRIPNWLCSLVAILFFPAAYLNGMAAHELGWHLMTGAILFLAGYILFSLKIFGGGDGKLMAAAGLWFGTASAIQFLFLTAIAGGLLVIIIAALALAQSHFEATGSSFGTSLKKLAPKVPYGVALAVGAILAFPNSWWMQHAV